MRKFALPLLALVLVSLAAPAAFSADAPAAASNGPDWMIITAGFSMAIASAACGIAQAKASSAASEAMARNPGASGTIQNMLILALVLIESMALYTFANLFIRVK